MQVNYAWGYNTVMINTRLSASVCDVCVGACWCWFAWACVCVWMCVFVSVRNLYSSNRNNCRMEYFASAQIWYACVYCRACDSECERVCIFLEIMEIVSRSNLHCAHTGRHIHRHTFTVLSNTLYSRNNSNDHKHLKINNLDWGPKPWIGSIPNITAFYTYIWYKYWLKLVWHREIIVLKLSMNFCEFLWRNGIMNNHWAFLEGQVK